MFGIFARIRFAIRYRTLKRICWVRSERPASVAVYHKGKVVKFKRECPHQGAPLEKGYLDGEDLVCSWHGCRFSLKGNHPPEPHQPLLTPISVRS